jgi:hypothetical protein
LCCKEGRLRGIYDVSANNLKILVAVDFQSKMACEKVVANFLWRKAKTKIFIVSIKIRSGTLFQEACAVFQLAIHNSRNVSESRL